MLIKYFPGPYPCEEKVAVSDCSSSEHNDTLELIKLDDPFKAPPLPNDQKRSNWFLGKDRVNPNGCMQGARERKKNCEQNESTFDEPLRYVESRNKNRRLIIKDDVSTIEIDV
jgi:hypothetical protein